MRSITCSVLVLLAATFVVSQNKTIVLVRHAEKAGETTMDKTGDPELSPDGQERAKRLLAAVKKYKPHEIFATAYRRVQQTVAPTAEFRHKPVQTYDPAKQAELVNTIMQSRTEHYLIAGHSNTIPALVNLLMGKEVFQKLGEAEYGVIWVVKIRKGKLKRVEVYEY